MAKASQSEGAALETWTDWTKWSEWDRGNEFGRGRKKETDKIKENEWKDGKNAQYSENYRKWYNQHWNSHVMILSTEYTLGIINKAEYNK